MFQQPREDEPSSSVPTSTSRDYPAGPSGSLSQPPSYRGNNVFQDTYGMQGSSVNNHIYEAAESSYESNQSEAQSEEYPDLGSAENEAQIQIPVYNSIDNEASNYGGPQAVASSSGCDEGSYPVHQLIVDAQNRIVAVQRVISPEVDSTVSQSLASTQQRQVNNGRAANSALFLQPLPQAQSEVSTSGENLQQTSGGRHHCDREEVQGHGEVEVDQSAAIHSVGSGSSRSVMESAVSSITGSCSNEAEVTMRRVKQESRRSLDDIVSGEPDTTQTDEDDDYAMDKDYEEDNSSIDNRDDINSSLMPSDSQPHPSGEHNLVDSTQIMTTRVPIVSSSISSHQISLSSLTSGFLTNSIASSYQHLLHSAGTSHAPNIASSEIALPHLAGSQVEESASSVESQLGQISYIFDSASVDAGMKIESSDLGNQMSAYIYSASAAPDDAQPGTSTQPEGSRRKSSRIAELDSEVSAVRRLQYESRPYNPNQLWCEECMQAYAEECAIHRLTPIQDRVVFSRAWASLPPLLQIFKILETDELGVFSKRSINKRTMFGPFVAELVDSPEKASTRFPLVAERDGKIVFYNTTDENHCNWMMFVRPAQTYAEQNMVAYQYENDIYFTVTKDITEPKTELRVWYAAHYAERWDKPLLEATEEDLQALEEQMCKFQCYECPKRFRTAAALQKHLIAHDSEPVRGNMVEEPSSSQQVPPPRQRRKRILPPHQSALRQKYLNVKKAEIGGADNAGSPAIYHWKKRSTNIYLNKTLKKYQKRHDGYIKKSMLNYFPKSAEKPEIECLHCDLAFSNTTLLSWHALSHNEAGQLQEENTRYQLDSQGTGSDSGPEISVLDCPACSQKFYQRKDLVEHVAQHGMQKSSRGLSSDYHADIMSSGPNRQHRCGICFKTFTTIDRLAKHHQCHGDDSQKPFQCAVCFKRFMNNSALSCHMKVHSTAKYYQCPICHLGFDQTSAMREHSLEHANPNGSFDCPHCEKVFSEFLVLKKHIRGFHTNRSFPCTICDKVFPRADKLRLHMLRHSNKRDFMCDTCGRQFKRKDKLKEHIKRMHSADREEKDRQKALRPKASRFIPKVSPTEYHRFIYKCHICLLGFKRRGMLVNHIAKRHPDLKPESVPELNLPILKTQRDYYCQYCDKVYKSSSKRKSHILKNHPGSELPQSARKKSNIDEIPGIPNPTYSQTVGSITTMPHQCEHCHKQYASKAKLLQHHRKHHPDTAPQIQERVKREMIQHLPQAADSATYVIERTDDIQDTQAADLLTQAMSELTQSVEFRQMSGGQGTEPAYLTTRLSQGAPAMVQIQTSSGQGTQTIELTHLSQALQHFAPPQGHLPIQVQVTGGGVTGQIQIPISATQAAAPTGGAHIVVDQIQQADSATSQTQQVTFPPISIVSGPYIPKTWTNYNYKQH